MDHIIESVGSFSKFQYRIVFIVGLVSALSSALIYATIFIAAEPDLLCQRLNSNKSSRVSSSDNEKLDYDAKCTIWYSILANDTNSKNYNEIKTSESYECQFDKTFYDVFAVFFILI